MGHRSSDRNVAPRAGVGLLLSPDRSPFMQTALEALVEARSLIGRPEKWWDGSGDTPLNRMCLHQAVAAALHKLQAGQRDPGAVREVYCALSEQRRIFGD